MIRNLAEAEIARVLTYELLIPATERALVAFSAGRGPATGAHHADGRGSPTLSSA